MYSGQEIIMLNARDKSAYTHPVKKWAISQWGGLFCAECHAPRRELYPAPIDVYLCQPPKPRSYSTVFRANVGVIHECLFSVLQGCLPGHARGRCFREDGSEIPECSSIYFRDTIIVRGRPNWPWYEPNAICGTCGIVRGATAEELYVLREELPDGQVFQDWGSDMYLAEDVARQFPWKQFRDLEPLSIEVRDELLPNDPVPARAV